VNAAAISVTTDPLTPRYEALRAGVVQAERNGVDLRGLAFLMRQGTAAWMRWAGTAEAPVTAAPRPPVSVPAWPEGIDPALVHIVAAMALAHVREMRA
jgi:hypothetical protein